MRTITRLGVTVATLTALLIFTTTFVKAFFLDDDSDITVPVEDTAAREEHVIAGAGDGGARLIIPSIGVDAPIDDVGIAASGNMAVPVSPDDVGWYRYGPAPGEPGSAVMAGHVDNGYGRPGVFARLGDLEPGDEVRVRDGDGQLLRFEVTSVRTYPYDDVPTEVLFNPSGTKRLNLVTCEGSWLSHNETYDHRLVVFTRLIE